MRLATVRTPSIIPVDLNSLMFHLEITIAKGCGETRDFRCAGEFAQRAAKHALGINRYLWNANGYYGDYDRRLAKARDNKTAAMVFPLFVGAAWPDRALKTAQQVQSTLLQPGGLGTTTYNTTQQWDAPNGWAPLHWAAIQGLKRYGQDALAQQIGTRFLTDVKGVYASEQNSSKNTWCKVRERAADGNTV